MKLRSKSLGGALTKFLWADLVLTALLIVNILIVKSTNVGENFFAYDSIVSLLIGLNATIYSIIFLIWLFKLHQDLKEIDPNYKITPGGALARVIIPFYNIYGLWNVYSTMSRWFKEQDVSHQAGERLKNYIPFYYVLFWATSLLNSALVRQPADQSFSMLWLVSYLGDMALVVMYILMIRVIISGLSGRLEEQKVIDEFDHDEEESNQSSI